MLNLWKKFLLCTLVFLWIAAPSVSRADRLPPGKWWQMPQVAEKLNLAPEQKQRLDELFMNNRRKLIDLKAELEKARLDLEGMLAKDPLDEAMVMGQFKKLEAARTNLGTEQFQFILQVRKLLGAERFQSLEALFKEFRGKQGRDGSDHRERKGPKPNHSDPDGGPGSNPSDVPQE